MAIGDFKFGVVILGAGRSSRMGRPKLLLPWGETSILGHLIRQWQLLGAAQIAIVRAVTDSALEREQASLGVTTDSIVNPAPDLGMFSSIQCAAQWRGWSPTLTNWVITLGDQPHLNPNTLQKLVEAAKERPEFVWQPAYQGRRHHPVMLPEAMFQWLQNTTSTDLKAFLNASSEPRQAVEVNDPGVDLDIDTPEDYERAKRLAGLA